MREIKFRAWCREGRCWLGSITLHSDGSWQGSIRQIEGYDESECDLVQYTGLKDKNDVEIYEGDVILIPTYPSESNPIGEPDMAVVKCVAGAFGFEYLNYKGQPTGMFDSFLSWNGESTTMDDEEVIGNIYENPELLKEAE